MSIPKLFLRRCAAVAGAMVLACPAVADPAPNQATAVELPIASHYAATVLPEVPGIVAWRVLADVKMEQLGIRTTVTFSPEILALDGTETKVQGFLIPLGASATQIRFLISAVPPDCPFCLPAGPDAMIEVLASTPVRYRPDPIVVSGRFAVLKDDDGGLMYRLTDAKLIGAAQAPTLPEMKSSQPSSRRKNP